MLFSRDNFEGRNIPKYDGFVKDLLDKLSEILHFTYEIRHLPDIGQYNKKTKEWDGLIRELLDKVRKILYFVLIYIKPNGLIFF